MSKISKDLLQTLYSRFGNVKANGVIRQYIYTDDTSIDDVREFFNFYYPEIDFDELIKCYENNKVYKGNDKIHDIWS